MPDPWQQGLGIRARILSYVSFKWFVGFQNSIAPSPNAATAAGGGNCKSDTGIRRFAERAKQLVKAKESKRPRRLLEPGGLGQCLTKNHIGKAPPKNPNRLPKRQGLG